MKKNKNIRSEFNSGYRPVDLSYFKPLQVVIEYGRFEDSARFFKQLVQKEKILSLYKEKQQYEKPSEKKRRKRKEADERRFATEMKEKLIKSGEWDKRIQRKQAKRQEKLLKRETENNGQE